MPLLRAVFVMALPVHGGDINSALLLRVNSRGWGGGVWKIMVGGISFGEGKGGGFESY